MFLARVAALRLGIKENKAMATDKDKPAGGTAGGAGPGAQQGSSSSAAGRKPVTIDLEAKPVDKATVDAAKATSAGAKPEQSAPGATKAATASAGATATAGAGSQQAKSAPKAADAAAGSAPPSSLQASTKMDAAAGSGSGPSLAEKHAAGKDAAKSAVPSQPEKPAGMASKEPGAPSGAKDRQAAIAKDKQGDVLPPPPVERSGIGLGGAFFAGLIGAAVVAGGGYGLLKSGYLPTAEATGDGDLRAALEASQSRIATLESRLAEIARSAGQQDAAVLKALGDRVATIEAGAGKDASEAASAIRKEVDTLSAGLSELRRFVSSGNAGESAGLASLQKTQETLEASIKEIGARVASAEEMAGGLAALRQELAGLQASLSQANAAVAELKAGLGKANGSIATLSGELTARAEADAAQIATLEGKLAALETRFEPLEKSLGGISSREVAARALAVSALRSALDAGRPYEIELAAVRAAVPQDTDLTSLAAHAGKGIPSKTALIGAFPSTVRAMSAALDRPAEGDVVGSFLSNARSLVSVRRTGEGAGDLPFQDAGLGQMEARVDAGDLAGALEAYATLPEPARAAGAEWADEARARVEADKLVREVTDTVLKGLAGSGS